MDDFERASAKRPGPLLGKPSRLRVHLIRHRPDYQDAGGYVLTECGVCRADLSCEKFMPEHAELQRVYQFELSKRGNDQRKGHALHAGSRLSRVGIWSIKGSEEAGVGVRAQYRARSWASSSAPLTLSILVP